MAVTDRLLERRASMIEQNGGHMILELVPKQCTIAGFAADVAASEGLDIREMEPPTTILVRTENSMYRIMPIQRGDSRVLIEGGRLFPEPTEARLAGSTFGGSCLQSGWIGVGMHLEIHAGGDPMITSRVRSITKVTDVGATVELGVPA